MPDDVQGFLTDAEGAELRRLALRRHVLEIGCWKGRSTIFMAKSALHVVSVDWFRGDAFTGPAFTLPEAVSNLDKYAVRDRVTLMVGDFRHVVPLLNLARFDFAFYDADHAKEPTEAALRLLLEGLPPTAALAVHDYDLGSPVWEPTVRAVDAAAVTYGRAVRIVDRLAILEAIPC